MVFIYLIVKNESPTQSTPSRFSLVHPIKVELQNRIVADSCSTRHEHIPESSTWDQYDKEISIGNLRRFGIETGHQMMVLCGAFFPNMREQPYVPEVYIFIQIGVEVRLPEDFIAVVIKSQMYPSYNKLSHPNIANKTMTNRSGNERKHGAWDLKFLGACLDAWLKACKILACKWTSTNADKKRITENVDNRRMGKQFWSRNELFTIRTLWRSVELARLIRLS